MPRLAIYLLGSPRVELDSSELHIPRRKALALLAYLAMERRPHRRDSLAALLWPGYDQSTARAHLRRALATLSKRMGRDWFCVDRDTIGLSPEQPLWLDVDAFRAHLAACEVHAHPMQHVCPECQQRLAQAAELYRDDFLAGFSLPDSLAFEEWGRFQAQSLRDELGSVLERLSACYAAQGNVEPAIAAARRWLELDPLREAAHRCLMELYARAGRDGAALRQYRVCLRVLETELGVPPVEETTALYERLRSERLVQTERPTSIPTPDGATALPVFLGPVEDVALSGLTPGRGESVFVAREVELAWLDGCLEAALGRQGKVVFVTGGPGRGKSALMRAFMGRALAAYPDLLVASGGCSAYAGAGDPYLPFREMMDMLTGDVESRWAAGIISREHARRLWAALPLMVRTLLDHGPHLIETLVPGQGLLLRLQTLRDSESLRVSAVAELQEWVELRRTTGAGLEQSRIFQQFADTLQSLAARHPLLLTLDDLQWVDNTSASLLFHLGRQLAKAGGRMLILGAYRPEEVTVDRAGERHPLRKVLGEFERHFGQIRLDLTAADQVRGRAFVDAYVDSEPNQLGEDFRSTLTERTGGHALFTVELLRAMQERGELVKNAQGEWVAGQELDWGRLPVRVEAVVQERVERLEEEARDLSVVASVEGEVFTAQAVARVQGLPERTVLHALSSELGPRGHRLVREAGELVVGGRHLSRFRFAHALFQEYVYKTLSASERRLLHGELGETLEGFYEGHTDEIAPALAQHYRSAGLLEKAAAYSLRAGELADKGCAFFEGIEHLRHALGLYHETGDRLGEAKTLGSLFLVHFHLGILTKEIEGYLQDALRLYRELGDRDGEAWIFHLSGYLYIYQSDLALAKTSFEQAAAIFRESGRLRRLAWTLQGLARFYHECAGDFERSRACADEGMRLGRELGDHLTEAVNGFEYGVALHYQGHYADADQYLKKGAQSCRELRLLTTWAGCLIHVGLNAIALGDYPSATAHLEESRNTNRRFGEEAGDDARTFCALALLQHHLDDNQTARIHAQRAIGICREMGYRTCLATALTQMGHALAALNDLDEACLRYQEALDLRREMGQRHLVPEPLAGLARVGLARDDRRGALAHVEEILSYLEASTPSPSATCPFDGSDEPLRIYLTCYRVLQANADPRAAEILTTGYNLLHVRAVMIPDETLRRSYLENVVAHRELVSEWQALQA